MSMSTHVVGIRPPDQTFKKMKAAWDACKAAGVAPPKAVVDFFNDETPDEAGVQIDIDCAAEEWNSDQLCASGIEVDINKLPLGVKIIRFYNSY